MKVILEFNLPVVIANLDGDRSVDKNFIPAPFIIENYYTLSVSFQPSVIKYALDDYAPKFASSDNAGPHQYKPFVYENLGL